MAKPWTELRLALEIMFEGVEGAGTVPVTSHPPSPVRPDMPSTSPPEAGHLPGDIQAEGQGQGQGQEKASSATPPAEELGGKKEKGQASSQAGGAETQVGAQGGGGSTCVGAACVCVCVCVQVYLLVMSQVYLLVID